MIEATSIHTSNLSPQPCQAISLHISHGHKITRGSGGASQPASTAGEKVTPSSRRTAWITPHQIYLERLHGFRLGVLHQKHVVGRDFAKSQMMSGFPLPVSPVSSSKKGPPRPQPSSEAKTIQTAVTPAHDDPRKYGAIVGRDTLEFELTQEDGTVPLERAGNVINLSIPSQKP